MYHVFCCTTYFRLRGYVFRKRFGRRSGGGCVDKQLNENATEMPFLLWKLVNQLQKQFSNSVWFYCVWPGHFINITSCWEQRVNFISSFTFRFLESTRRAESGVHHFVQGSPWQPPGWYQQEEVKLLRELSEGIWTSGCRNLFTNISYVFAYYIFFFFFFGGRGSQARCVGRGVGIQWAVIYSARVNCRKNYFTLKSICY